MWLSPDLKAEIAYRGLKTAGQLRHEFQRNPLECFGSAFWRTLSPTTIYATVARALLTSASLQGGLSFTILVSREGNLAFDVVHVTNTLLQRAFKERRSDMTPLKVQKMLFFTHGWHLAITGLPAIDRPFEAWPYGPVVQRIYSELKEFGGDPVTRYIKEASANQSTAFVVNEANKDLYQAVDISWEKYIGIGAAQLSTMTHEPGSPWDVTKKAGRNTIPNDLIRDYFVRLAA